MERITSKQRRIIEEPNGASSIWFPSNDSASRKGHGHPFPVTVGALIGACFPPILRWCRHDDSHFLRAVRTKQHPGGSRDCLARHMIMHRHDDFPLVGKTTRGISLGRWPSRVYIKLLAAIFRDLLKQEQHCLPYSKWSTRTPSSNRQRVIFRLAIAPYVRYPHITKIHAPSLKE
jgi:hypothetical protein